MNYQQIYSEVDTIVTKYRKELEYVWPTPPAGDCLKFAVTEAGSANQQQGYLYSNAKNFGHAFAGSTMLVIECGAALDKFESEGGASLQRPITICLQLLGEDAPERVESRLQKIKTKVTKE